MAIFQVLCFLSTIIIEKKLKLGLSKGDSVFNGIVEVVQPMRSGLES